jgi:hypothetical protein
MALLLQGLVALAHNPVFLAAQVPGLDGLVSICTPDGWNTVDRQDDAAPFGKTSPAADLCALCHGLQAAVIAPPAVFAPIPARAFVLVSAASPPGRSISGSPAYSPRQPRAPPAFA